MGFTIDELVTLIIALRNQRAKTRVGTAEHGKLTALIENFRAALCGGTR